MATYIYCPRGSTGAFELGAALGATRLRRFDGAGFWGKNKRIPLKDGSVIVCWGATLPEMDGMRVLNSLENPLDKYGEHVAFINAGLKTINARRTDHYTTAKVLRAQGYLPRTAQHTGGLDLLNPPAHPSYWVLKEKFTEEYRVHSFGGKSIRAGHKVVRDDFAPVEEAQWQPNSRMAHPWVRSWDGGWRISYRGFKSTQAMRHLASLAVKALGLTFGAVDMAVTPDGTLKLLEVNTAPGIEGGTLEAYVEAVKRWIDAKEPQGA